MSTLQFHDHKIHIGSDWKEFNHWIEKQTYGKYFVLVDENTRIHCLPFLKSLLNNLDLNIIEIQSGEENKTLETCDEIWSELLHSGADRNALLINLGGGVIGDMGGFAAACFMRGIDFVQVPTSLLSQVDASVGSKTGVDFKKFKNLVGLFCDPAMVWIEPEFLKTLDQRQLTNGFAEIIKHALIQDRNLWNEIKTKNSLDLTLPWQDWIYQSVKIKKAVVDEDFQELGLRKILNFGHTLGHAIESHFLGSGQLILHGEAIAIGMICEAYISSEILNLSANELVEISKYLLQHFPHNPSFVIEKESIVDLMKADKKNIRGQKMFSLLESIGKCQFNIKVEEKLITESLEYYASLA